MKIYEALADAFVREKVKTCFALLGDANMHWAGAMSERDVDMIFTRHEHAAVAGATAFARASCDQVGVASVTCGPGLTQIMTILPIAVRARIPLVIFAGEAPLTKPWYNQGIDQAPFVEACGAVYRSLHEPEEMVSEIHQAFADAKEQRTAIVLGVPFDLQQKPCEPDRIEKSSSDIFQAPAPLTPDPQAIASAARWIAAAKQPIVLAGLGAVSIEAKEACELLASKAGALLATTLPAKGLFHDADFSLGVAGGFATEKSKEILTQSDLVIGIGTRLAAHAFDGGKLTPNAKVIHIDIDPQEYVQGRKAADLLIQSDAAMGAEALANAIQTQIGWRTDAQRIAAQQALEMPDDVETPDGYLHPMAVFKSLANAIPPECHVINTSGHCAYYAAQMNKHPQSHYTVIRDFGAIGNGTSFALGVAAAHPDRPIVLIDGDGSALMHIQELETIKRHGLKVLIVVINDGAYGSEVHKLRADGVTDAGSIFGRPDFASIGQGFGFRGVTITDINAIQPNFDAFLASGEPAIWDIHVSDKIASPQILKAHKAAHK